MERLEIDFWRIELQITNNISNLLSIYLKEKSVYEGQNICLLEQPEHFGSWVISRDNRQVIYDGKDRWFVMRMKKIKVYWINETVIKLDEITPEKINLLYSRLIGYTS